MHNQVQSIDNVVHVHENALGKLDDEFVDLFHMGLTNNVMTQNDQNHIKMSENKKKG